MIIDDKLIDYLEELSNLALSQEEKQRISADLTKIIGYMDLLCELDTESVPERSHPFDNVNAFREDEISPSFDRELILKNAPYKSAGMFVTSQNSEFGIRNSE